jgi:hypothetical protein
MNERIKRMGDAGKLFFRIMVNKTVTDQIQCKNKKVYGKPISWSIEDHGEYYIIKCLVHVESNPYIHFSTSDGVIGVDCNYNHIAWTNVSKDGNFLESGKLTFSIEGKTSDQITKIIEAEAIALVDITVRKKKPNGRWCTFYMCFHRHIAGRPERDTSDILYGYSSR